MKTGSKKRAATEIRECEEQRSNMAPGAEIFTSSLGSGLAQQENTSSLGCDLFVFSACF